MPTTTASGTEVAYDLMGDGPPLVLLHAGGMDRRMWDDQRGPLAERFTVVRLDAPAAGESPVPTEPYRGYEVVVGLLDALGIDSAHVVGLSQGARTAADVAVAYPDRVHRLVLAAPGLSGVEFSDDYVGRLKAAFEPVARGYADALSADDWRETYLAVAPRHAAARERMVRLMTDNADTTTPEALALGRELDPPAQGRLGEVTAPTLVVVGDRDWPDIQTVADVLADGIDGAEKAVVAGAGHLVNLERPEAFTDLVLDFLSRDVP